MRSLSLGGGWPIPDCLVDERTESVSFPERLKAMTEDIYKCGGCGTEGTHEWVFGHTCRGTELAQGVGAVTEPAALHLTLSDQGRMFVGVATIRAAIFDVLDRGDQDEPPWAFYEHDHGGVRGLAWTEDDANVERRVFVDNVIARIAELQSPPHDGIKLENLCPRHRREALPVPTAQVCGMCQAERAQR